MVELQDSAVRAEQGVVRLRRPGGDSRPSGGADRRVPDDLQAMSEPAQAKDQGVHSGSKLSPQNEPLCLRWVGRVVQQSF